MSEELAQADLPVAEEAELVFEQPLNERMRTFLRIDFLYSQATYHNDRASEWGSRAAIASLIDILAITTRGDARADALKELERQLSLLNEFQAKPSVDTSRLRAVMSNLMRLRTELLAAGSAYLQPIKESEFLAAVKHRSAIPGGTCEFDLPDYFYWLQQPTAARTQAFNEWLTLLRPLCDSIAELLWLTRQNGRPRKKWRRAARSISLSTASPRCSCCASACRSRSGSIRKSAAATIVRVCASSPGTVSAIDPRRRARMCPSR